MGLVDLSGLVLRLLVDDWAERSPTDPLYWLDQAGLDKIDAALAWCAAR